MEEFDHLQAEFLDLQNKAFKMAFRILDNKKQSDKGQPSLDREDTGIQWKNDPVK